MKKIGRVGALLSLLLAGTGLTVAQNYAWPSKFEGVMLQGFYWDSYKGTDNSKWTTLTSQADELSESFKVIWVPNSAKAASNPSMGYDPVYWFTNHNSSFGTEAQLKTMISTFKEKGTDIIEDVVINHRSGLTNWTNFPKEQWRGTWYQLGPEHICKDDEVKDASGQAKPTGNYDTGEGFSGARDLDHTNTTVQENIKAYTTFLLEDLGYAGFRYDMVKGYAGKYTKTYNTASKPKYSVGEYWDGNYDAVAAWIEATGRQSAAFDYPLKYAINDAFASNDMSKLCWMANGTTPQPAGMIHCNYQQYSVTFIDNHDTYRDSWNKFNGNIVAANAFIICSPGTPCIFLPHWQAYKSEIKALIAARNAAGVHNQSAVTVLRHDKDCYMAEVTGSKAKLVVKIGNAQVAPNGYTNADIKATGTGYCVWSKATGGGEVVIPTPNPEKDFDIYFDNTPSKWTTPYIHYWGNTESTWPGVKMTKESGNIWKYTVPSGTTGILFNAGDGDNTKTLDFTALADHVYTIAGDQGVYGQPRNYPEKMYIIGHLNVGTWNPSKAIAATTASEGIYKWPKLEITESDDTAGKGFFSFITATGADWDIVNSSDRYGAISKDESLNIGNHHNVQLFAKDINASAANSWAVNAGIYDVTLNLQDMTVLFASSSGIDEIDADSAVTPVYFTLQGVKVENPTEGLYIIVNKGKASKVLIK